MSTDPKAFKNNTLSRLPVTELNLIAHELTHVLLEPGASLCNAGDPIEKLFFIESGLVSAAILDTDKYVQVGMVGSDGFVGCSTMVSPNAISYWQVNVEIRGEALMIPTSLFHRYLDRAPTLRKFVEEQAQLFIGQVAQTSICNNRHSIPHRIARWLLIARDKARTDDLPLSSELIANGLGLTRIGLQMSLRDLEEKELVRATRLRTLILDRYGLEEVACNCYAHIRAFTERLEARANISDRLQEL